MLGTTVFILFIMLVAAANLCLGFAVAIALGVGPQTWPPAALASAVPPAETEHSAVETEASAGSDSPAPREPELSTAPQVRLTAPDEIEPRPVVEVTLETLLVQLSRGFDRFEAELGDWDHRRREGELDVDHLTNSAIELHGLASGYLEQFQASIVPLDQFGAHDLDAVAAQNAIGKIASELAVKLRTTTAELGSLHFEAGDDNAASEKMTTALLQVTHALHEARDQLEEPLTALIRCESDLTNPAPVYIESAKASLLGRICFEHLWETRPSCVALLDVDKLQQLHATHGLTVVRKLLQALGELARGLAPIGTPVPVLSGQQFVICCCDCTPSAAVELVETIRRRIEQSRFTIADLEIHATVSAAVVVVLPDDTSTTVLARMRSTVQEAKRYGRNRTFVCEQQTPVPVAPTQLTIEIQTVPI